MSIGKTILKSKTLENMVWSKWILSRSYINVITNGKDVFIDFIDRNLTITSIHVDVNELLNKTKHTMDTQVTLHMMHDDVTFRIINTNDQFVVLNVLEEAFSGQRMPLIHDSEGFIALIPKGRYRITRKNEVWRNYDNEPELKIFIDHGHRLSDKNPTPGAKEFAASIALAMQLHLDFVEVIYSRQRDHSGRYLRNEFITLITELSDIFKSSKMSVATSTIIRMVDMLSTSTDAVGADREELFY